MKTKSRHILRILGGIAITVILCLATILPAASPVKAVAYVSGTLWSFSGVDTSNNPNLAFVDLSNVTSFNAAQTGGYLAVKTDGTVWAWGDNSSGQLGNGTTTNSYTTPVQVRAGTSGSGYLTNVIAVSGGANWSVAVKNDGTVWAWGNNYGGQLGTGTSGYEGTSAQYITTPVQVTGGTSGTTYLTGAIAVSAGFDHTLVLKGDGTVWAWGGSQSGQLGNGTQGINHGQSNYYLSAPVQVSGLTNIKSISAANYFSIALTTGGNVWTWGDNTWSNLGINKTWSDQNVSLVPVEVKGPSGTGALSNIDLVSARGVHCLAYQSTSGNIYGWGSDV